MHCDIKYDESEKYYMLQDHASQNGTFVNDKRLSEVSEKEKDFSKFASEKSFTHQNCYAKCSTSSKALCEMVSYFTEAVGLSLDCMIIRNHFSLASLIYKLLV